MKTLLALALMVALLAIGNTAGAGPFGVSMGDPIKPNVDGWGANGLGTEDRKYKGSLPFDIIFIEGMQKGGACQVRAVGRASSRESALQRYERLRVGLVDKYGKPGKEEPKAGWFGRRSSSDDRTARWWPKSNPDKIKAIVLWIVRAKSGTHLDNYVMVLQYFFENIQECEKAKAGEL